MLGTVSQEAVGILQYSLIGKWKTKPAFCPSTKELEAWSRTTWRLKGGVLIAFLNEDLLFLEFDSKVEVRGVLEAVRRNFKWSFLQLDCWRPEVGCIRRKDTVKEAWIIVFGLPLHLWTLESQKRIGDACGGFIALDKFIVMRMKVLWARLLIKLTRNPRLSVFNILEGGRSFQL